MKDLKAAVKWLESETHRTQYGNISLTVVMTGGDIKFIETSLIQKYKQDEEVFSHT